jgi:hypothetical protein
LPWERPPRKATAPCNSQGGKATFFPLLGLQEREAQGMLPVVLPMVNLCKKERTKYKGEEGIRYKYKE